MVEAADSLQLYLDFVKGSTKTAMDAGKIPVHWEEVYSNFRTQLDKKSVVHGEATRSLKLDSFRQCGGTVI